MVAYEYGRVLITSNPALATIHAGYLGRFAAGWRQYRPLLGRFDAILDGAHRPGKRIINEHIARLRADGWNLVGHVIMPQGVAELRFQRARP